jgi:hypothetical protein
VVRIRAAKIQFYQINYALYDEKTSLATFDPEPSAEQAKRLAKVGSLWRQAGGDISRFTAPRGANVELTRTTVALEPNSSKTVFQADRGGRIVGLRISPAEAIAGKARDLLLKISFDGEGPAVFCPLGDFFGYAWGEPAMRSLLIGTNDDTNYCYLPMPYDRGVSIEIVSERKGPVTLQAEVMHAAVPRSAGEGRFYALWRRENPTKPGELFTLLETTGRGHLVGVVLQSQGLKPGLPLFFEGDDQTTIDGEKVIFGTGSEDFFNGGWYDLPGRWDGRRSYPLSGCLGYSKDLGRTGGYRFFLGDAYPFRGHIHQTIEHGGENNSVPTDYASVTYFYCAERPTANFSLVPAKDRAVSEPR